MLIKEGDIRSKKIIKWTMVSSCNIFLLIVGDFGPNLTTEYKQHWYKIEHIGSVAYAKES